MVLQEQIGNSLWGFILISRRKVCCHYPSLEIHNLMLDKIKIRIFVELNMIPLLLYQMHVIANSWHICVWFGNHYLAGILSPPSHQFLSCMFYLSLCTCYLFMLKNSIIQLYNSLDKYKMDNHLLIRHNRQLHRYDHNCDIQFYNFTFFV